MAQSIFDALSGVTIDTSAVQSLLESQNLISEIEQSGIDQDEEDIFQCGKCKCQFTVLHLFLLHKKAHLKKQQTVDLSQYLINDNNQVQVDDTEIPCQQVTQYNPTHSSEAEFIQSNQPINEPIILQETDMLFSMDQESANYLSAESGFGVSIILGSENLESFTVSSNVADNNNLLKNDTQELCVQAVENNQTPMETTDFSTISQGQEELSADNEIQEDNIQELDEQINNNHINNNSCSNNNSDNSNDNHTNNTPINLKYKCNYCHKQFSKKFYWQQHERSHTGEKPYQCVVCGRAFAQKSNVKKHMSSHKVWPGTAIHSLPPEAPPDGTSIDRTYHCQFCKEIFDSYKALKGHLIVSHMTLKVYKCVQSSCSKMFSDLDDFLEHTRSHKRSEYRCHVCGEMFHTLSDLGLHQYAHAVRKQKTTEKYYCCTTCKSSFSNLEALQHHTETTTHDYACPHCGKSFLIERFLRRHLKTHVAAAKFTCEDCGKAFKTEQYLANHKLIHSDETPFLCTQCPAKFKRKDRLGRHMLIHDFTKRLKCPFRVYLGCMSEFSRPDKLKRHLLTHSNIKRFHCTCCNRDFNRAQALKHYEINKHVIKCELCSQSFKSKDQLATHTDCAPTSLESNKKHSSPQLPKKAFGTFKSRRPTPKRQMLTTKVIGSPEKEKSKTDDFDKRMLMPSPSEDAKLHNFNHEIPEETKRELISDSTTADSRLNSSIENLERTNTTPKEENKKSDTHYHLKNQLADLQFTENSLNID